MAVGRALQHQHASRRIAWRPAVLICMAIMAAAFASYSLIVDPPDTSRASPSYLP